MVHSPQSMTPATDQLRNGCKLQSTHVTLVDSGEYLTLMSDSYASNKGASQSKPQVNHRTFYSSQIY